VKIRALILAILVGLLILQPSFAWFGFAAAYGKCDKPEPVKQCTTAKKQCPVKKSCSDQEPAKDKGCEEKKCNPLLGCTAGNFYVHQYSGIILIQFRVRKQKAIVKNDNRLQKQLNECFHPPEYI
jgi:hypothetical protein